MLGYLFLPIFVIILYSFNKPAGKFNFVWKAFSIDAWRNPFAYEALYESMKLSLRVAALSSETSPGSGGTAVGFSSMLTWAARPSSNGGSTKAIHPPRRV